MEMGAQSVDASDEDAGTPLEEAIYKEPVSYDVFADPAWMSANYWNRCVVRAIVPADVEGRLLGQIREIYGDIAVERRALDASIDWLAQLESLRPPVHIGALRIVLPWHEMHSKNDLRIEGATAFGTGEHATTRMCGVWLQGNVKPGARLLDYGTGSGILALIALKVGAKQAIGVDVDDEAVRAATRNADANAYAEHARFYAPRLDVPIAGYPPSGPAADIQRIPEDVAPFDIVIANILLNPLIELSSTLASLVEPEGGVLAVSGIRRSQFDDFRAAYAHLFHDIRLVDEDDGWILVVCRDRR